MLLRNHEFASLLAVGSLTMLFLFTGPASRAQDSGGFELHANGNVTAADIGLPAYPGAKIYKNPKSDGALDMGFTFGATRFRLVVASYETGASSEKIFDFYRKPLARFGEVLECDHGKPVGALKAAKGGLTCADSEGGNAKEGGHIQVDGGVDSSSDHELRAGTPHHFRIVGIGEKQGDSIRFGLVEVELPKDDAEGKK
jgi:hypothetical protein